MSTTVTIQLTPDEERRLKNSTPLNRHRTGIASIIATKVHDALPYGPRIGDVIEARRSGARSTETITGGEKVVGVSATRVFTEYGDSEYGNNYDAYTFADHTFTLVEEPF